MVLLKIGNPEHSQLEPRQAYCAPPLAVARFGAPAHCFAARFARGARGTWARAHVPKSQIFCVVSDTAFNRSVSHNLQASSDMIPGR